MRNVRGLTDFFSSYQFQLGEHIVKYQTLYSGATIMQCNKFIIEYQKKYLDRESGKIASANQRNRLTETVMEISTVENWALEQGFVNYHKRQSDLFRSGSLWLETCRRKMIKSTIIFRSVSIELRSLIPAHPIYRLYIFKHLKVALECFQDYDRNLFCDSKRKIVHNKILFNSH